MLAKVISIFFILSVITLVGIRSYDWYSDKLEWCRLLSLQSSNPTLYHPSLVKDLPEPAQRFFNFSIKTGTPLLTIAEIEMTGMFSLGTKAQPNYQHMHARQILAAPNGFLWQLHLPSMLPISGSDSSSWTRFRILGIIPVARQGGDENHKRSAFGRYIAEAVFWTPAALLPSENVNWQQIEQNTSRVTVHHAGLTQAVDIEVDQTGKPLKIKFMRWSNANAEKVFRLQPFGGYLSDFRQVQGFTIPFYVEAGNMFGTDEYFPFFKAKIEKIVF